MSRILPHFQIPACFGWRQAVVACDGDGDDGPCPFRDPYCVNATAERVDGLDVARAIRIEGRDPLLRRLSGERKWKARRPDDGEIVASLDSLLRILCAAWDRSLPAPGNFPLPGDLYERNGTQRATIGWYCRGTGPSWSDRLVFRVRWQPRSKLISILTALPVDRATALTRSGVPLAGIRWQEPAWAGSEDDRRGQVRSVAVIPPAKHGAIAEVLVRAAAAGDLALHADVVRRRLYENTDDGE